MDSSPLRLAGSLLTSQTFWIALGAIGTVAGLFFIHRQVQHARNVAAYEFLRREDDRFRTDEMRRHRSQLAIALLQHPSDYSQLNSVADYLLDYFEDLGVILKKGLSPDYFMWSMNCYYVLHYWQALSPFISWARNESHDKTYYADFEYLCRRVAKTERRETGEEGSAIADDALKSFLREEVWYEIRVATMSDLPYIMQIEKNAFPIDDYPESQVRELLENHPQAFFVASLFGEIVGYAVGYLAKGENHSEFDSMAVHLRYRRLGIGRALVDRVLQQLRELGAITCSLEVRPSNLAAICMYEDFGFQVHATEANYYVDGSDAYVLSAVLRPGEGTRSVSGGECE